MDVKKDDSAEEIKELFVAGLLRQTGSIGLQGRAIPVSMSWAEGMIGVLPVFGTLEAAKAYTGEDLTAVILPITMSFKKLH